MYIVSFINRYPLNMFGKGKGTACWFCGIYGAKKHNLTGICCIISDYFKPNKTDYSKLATSPNLTYWKDIRIKVD